MTCLAPVFDALNHASIIEGVFSTDGYLAPLEEICDLASGRW